MNAATGIIRFSDKDIGTLCSASGTTDNARERIALGLQGMEHQLSVFCHATGLTPSNIALIFRQNGASAIENIHTFISNPLTPSHLQLLRDDGFTNSNIAELLKNSRHRALDILALLASPEGHGQLKSLQKAGFSAHEIADLLKGRTDNTANVLASLASEETLAKVTALRELHIPGRQTPCFGPQSIARMITYAGGNHPAERINIIYENRDRLAEIAPKMLSHTEFPGDWLATNLSNAKNQPAKDNDGLAARIETLHGQLAQNPDAPRLPRVSSNWKATATAGSERSTRGRYADSVTQRRNDGNKGEIDLH